MDNVDRLKEARKQVQIVRDDLDDDLLDESLVLLDYDIERLSGDDGGHQ